jgi:hypothetical protein
MRLDAGEAAAAGGMGRAPEQEEGVGEGVEGRAYCFLPLPILTGLPVHCNVRWRAALVRPRRSSTAQLAHSHTPHLLPLQITVARAGCLCAEQ